MSYEFITDNRPGISRDKRIEIIARVLAGGGQVADALNLYGGGKVCEKTMVVDGEKSTYYTTSNMGYEHNESGCKALFLPSREEVLEALEAFREKGWHAYYDSEMHKYAVRPERIVRGEYAERFTHWIF